MRGMRAYLLTWHLVPCPRGLRSLLPRLPRGHPSRLLRVSGRLRLICAAYRNAAEKPQGGATPGLTALVA
jgi:hypothetical protein